MILKGRVQESAPVTFKGGLIKLEKGRSISLDIRLAVALGLAEHKSSYTEAAYSSGWYASIEQDVEIEVRRVG